MPCQCASFMVCQLDLLFFLDIIFLTTLFIGDKRPKSAEIVEQHDVVLTTCKYMREIQDYFLVLMTHLSKIRLLKLPSVIKKMANPRTADSSRESQSCIRFIGIVSFWMRYGLI